MIKLKENYIINRDKLTCYIRQSLDILRNCIINNHSK